MGLRARGERKCRDVRFTGCGRGDAYRARTLAGRVQPRSPPPSVTGIPGAATWSVSCLSLTQPAYGTRDDREHQRVAVTAERRQRLRASVFGSTVTEVRTVLWTGGAMMIGQFLLAAHGILAARALGPDGKGLMTALTTWGQVLGWIAIAGLGTASGVRLARMPSGSRPQEDDLRAVLGNTLVFAAVAGGGVAASAAFVLPGALAHLGPSARSLSILSLSLIPIAIIANVTWAVQLALGRSALYNIAQVVNPVVMIAVTSGFMATVGLTPGRAIVSTILGALLSFVVATKGLPWRRMRFSARMLRADLGFGLKVHLGGVFQLANYRLDYLVMSAILPAVQLGLYGTANTFMLPLATVSGAVAVLLTPKVARLAGTTEARDSLVWRQRELITAEATRYTLVALGGGIVVALVGPFLLPLLLGSAYRPSIHLMWVLTPGYVVLCFSSVVAAGTAGMGRAWLPVIIQGCSIIVTLVLLPILLPRYQATGAAVTSTLAYATSAVAACGCLIWLKARPAESGEAVPPPGEVLFPRTVSS